MVDASIRAASHPGHRILGRVRSPIHLSNSTRLFVPAARFLRPGFAFPLRSPGLRGGGAPRDVRMLARHPLGLHVTRQARHLSRRLASYTEDARLPALHRGDFRLRSHASFSGISSGSVQRAPRSQVVVPGGRGPVPPGMTVVSRRRGTPRLAPPSGSPPEMPLNEQSWTCL